MDYLFITTKKQYKKNITFSRSLVFIFCFYLKKGGKNFSFYQKENKKYRNMTFLNESFFSL